MLYPARLNVNTKTKKSIAFYQAEVYDPKEFDFQRQTTNYENIQAALALIGTKLSVVGIEYFDSYTRTWGHRAEMRKQRFRFVAFAGPASNPFFIWQKYEGANPAGAQNMIYFDGQEYRLSDFLSQINRDGDAILECVRFKAIIWES